MTFEEFLLIQSLFYCFFYGRWYLTTSDLEYVWEHWSQVAESSEHRSNLRIWIRYNSFIAFRVMISRTYLFLSSWTYFQCNLDKKCVCSSVFDTNFSVQYIYSILFVFWDTTCYLSINLYELWIPNLVSKTLTLYFE